MLGPVFLQLVRILLHFIFRFVGDDFVHGNTEGGGVGVFPNLEELLGVELVLAQSVALYFPPPVTKLLSVCSSLCFVLVCSFLCHCRQQGS